MEKSMIDSSGNKLLSANEVASLRMFISGLVMISVFLKNLKIAFSKDWIWFFLVGLLGNLIPAFLFTNAQKTLSSSFTGTLNSLVPIFAVLVAVFVFKQKLTAKAFLGVILGFTGTIALIYFNNGEFDKIAVTPTLLVVLATICYAFSLNIIKNKLNHASSMAITGISLIFIMIPAIFVILQENTIEKIGNPVYTEAFGYILILSLVCTTFALIIFNQLIKMTTSIFASSVTYLIPIVAIMWGIYFNEKITWAFLFIGLTLIGIYIVKKEEGKRIEKK